MLSLYSLISVGSLLPGDVNLAPYVQCLLFVFILFVSCLLFRWMFLMLLNVTAKKDDNSLSWRVRIMDQDRHVTGRRRDLGCRYVK